MSVLGACIGDAVGGVLEFIRRKPTQTDVDEALTLSGGGIMLLEPGQITDDGELTLSLLSALQTSSSIFPIREVICAYYAWYNSNPIDCGNTCRTAFLEADEVVYDRMTVQEYLNYVQEENAASEANGALMRVTAIPHWAYMRTDLTVDEIANMARIDATLSHPNKICQDCNAILTYACVQLLRGIQPSSVWDQVCAYAQQSSIEPRVMQWLLNDSADIRNLNMIRTFGHVRWGFTMAMYFLRNPHIEFKDALRAVLLQGGDTDTNAAIVGGLVGCYNDVPDDLKHGMLASTPTDRPSWLHPAQYIQ